MEVKVYEFSDLSKIKEELTDRQFITVKFNELSDILLLSDEFYIINKFTPDNKEDIISILGNLSQYEGKKLDKIVNIIKQNKKFKDINTDIITKKLESIFKLNKSKTHVGIFCPDEYDDSIEEEAEILWLHHNRELSLPLTFDKLLKVVGKFVTDEVTCRKICVYLVKTKL